MSTNEAFRSCDDFFDSQIDLECILEAERSTSFQSADLIQSLFRSQPTSDRNRTTTEEDQGQSCDQLLLEGETTITPANQTMAYLEGILQRKMAPFGATPPTLQTPARTSPKRKRSHDEITLPSNDPFSSGEFREFISLLDDDHDGTSDITYLDSYNPEDVLAERGHRSNKNPGNAKYLKAKESLQSHYLAASRKDVKSRIAQELIDTVHAWGGRFLRFDKNRSLWYELDEQATRRKASQALREHLTAEDREKKRQKYNYCKKK